MIPPYGNHGNQKCPLVVVPADKKWFTRAVVAAATVTPCGRSTCIFQKWMRPSGQMTGTFVFGDKEGREQRCDD
jgi:hypothetical protein